MIQKFKRNQDNKVFICTFASHWSDIKSDDGETDHIKWTGGSQNNFGEHGEQYVSSSKGFSYTKLPVEY